MFTQRTLCLSLVAAAMSVLAAGSAQGQTARFDFDKGDPALWVGQQLPFAQRVTAESGTGDFRARFTSPAGNDFEIQTATNLGLEVHVLNGKFLWPRWNTHNVLDLEFDRFMSSITLTFATLDKPPVTSSIYMTMYQDTVASPPVGAIVTEGTYGTSMDYPHGQVTFTTTGQPFNVVRLNLDGGVATGFAIDDIQVVAAECQADFDGDDATVPSHLAIHDIFAFLNGWFACSYRADFNHDGVQNVADIFDFLNAWFEGCP